MLMALGDGKPRAHRFEMRSEQDPHILIAWLLIAVLFAGNVAFGANSRLLAMEYSAMISGLCLMLLLLDRSNAVAAVRGAGRLIPLFMSVILLAAFTISPLAPVGVRSIDPSSTLQEIIKLAGFGAAFLSGMIICSDARRAAVFFQGLMIAFLIFVAITATRHTLGHDTAADLANGRFAATFGSPNSAATFIGLGVVVSMSLLSAPSSQWMPLRTMLGRRVLPAGVLLVCASALGLTASRAGASATAVACALVLIAAFLGSTRRTTRFAIIGVAVVATAMIFIGTLTNRDLQARFNLLPNDLAGRQVLYEAHWAALFEFPWFGTGLGTFDARNLSLINIDNYFALWNIRAAHDLYLEWLTSGGFVVSTPMAVCGLIVFLKLVVSLWRNSSNFCVLAALGCGTLALIHGIVDFGLQEPAIALTVAAILGAGTARAGSATDARIQMGQSSVSPSQPRTRAGGALW